MRSVAVAPFLVALLLVVGSCLPAWPRDVIRLAVLELSGGIGADERMLLADAVRGAAVDGLSGQVTVMTRENMEVMLSEMGVDPGCVSEGACEVETARNLGVDYVVSGSVVSVSGTLVLSIKLHETKTGSLLGSRQVRGADALALLDAVAEPTRAMLSVLPGAPQDGDAKDFALEPEPALRPPGANEDPGPEEPTRSPGRRDRERRLDLDLGVPIGVRVGYGTARGSGVGLRVTSTLGVAGGSVYGAVIAGLFGSVGIPTRRGGWGVGATAGAMLVDTEPPSFHSLDLGFAGGVDVLRQFTDRDGTAPKVGVRMGVDIGYVSTVVVMPGLALSLQW
jgi:TolB-like protein